MTAITRRLTPYVLVSFVCVSLTILVMRSQIPSATAQQTPMQSSIVLGMGALDEGIQPLFVIDTVEQSLLVYEYGYDKQEATMILKLKAVRNDQYDKYLKELNTFPRLREVGEKAQKQKAREQRTRRR